jgi:hypothetical protein
MVETRSTTFLEGRDGMRGTLKAEEERCVFKAGGW